MNAFSYYCPTRLVFGAGVTSQTGQIVAGLGVRSVLLASGSGATRTSAGFAAVRASLEAAGIQYRLFDKVLPDPTAAQVAEAAGIIREADLQAVVAYGGGSPIDCAKSAALSAANGIPMLDFIYGKSRPEKPALPIIAIPTTAGTGSEMSNAAVTTDRDNNRKLGFSHESFFPQVAIVDPENQVSMPPSVTAATGMDAMTHVIESFLSLAANPVADGIDLQSVSMMAKALPVAFADGKNLEARSAMAIASATAAAAFSQTGLGMVHGFAHPVGARHGLAHGVANAIILPFVLAALARDAAPRMRDLAVAMGACPSGASPAEGADALVRSIASMKTTLGIPAGLGDAGVNPEHAPAILADALTYRMRARSSRQFTDAELGRLLDAAIAGDLEAARLR